LTRSNSHKAVLWDLDGTLVDSADFHWQSWRDAMAAEGREITHDEFLESFGQRNDRILRHWLGPEADDALIERIGSRKEERYRELIRANGIAPLPGAAEWVRRLAEEGWRQAIASSAPLENVQVVLEALKLRDYFGAIASAEDVRHGKPDPEVFLVAASRLEVEPARSIVVEDAPAGVEAARRGGMRSIGVQRGGEPLTADIVVKSLADLAPGAFSELLERQRSREAE
jgi:beta-phosphoglucomutase